jgi:hypothetical protein
MSEIPFETIKERAKQALSARIARCDPIHQDISFDWKCSALMPIPYAMLGGDERIQLDAGRADGSQGLAHVSRIGHRIIDRWNVRCVASLIDHLPECVPRHHRRAAIVCYLDDDTGSWIVAFTDRSSRAGMPRSP